MRFVTSSLDANFTYDHIQLKSASALQDVGQPEDVANFVSYLVSPAGRVITGKISISIYVRSSVRDIIY